MFFVLVTVLGVTGASAAAQEQEDTADEVVTRLCTFFHDYGEPPYIDEACAMAVRAGQGDDTSADEAVSRFCTFFHYDGGHPYIDEGCETAVRMATREAAGWSDYDLIAISEAGLQQEIARCEAAAEAMGWSGSAPTSS